MADTEKKATSVVYRCDGEMPNCKNKERGICYMQNPKGDCRWTYDITHALNFSLNTPDGNIYMEGETLRMKYEERVSEAGKPIKVLVKRDRYKKEDCFYDGEYMDDLYMGESENVNLPHGG